MSLWYCIYHTILSTPLRPSCASTVYVCQLTPTRSHPSNPTPNGSNLRSSTCDGSEVESSSGISLGVCSCLIWGLEDECSSEEDIMSIAGAVCDDEIEK